MQKPLLIVIAGPTASGKTALAIEVARHFHTEILSADSRQCYRELNIGVAKPTEEELNSAAHHFINSHSVTCPVNAGLFERYGLEVLENIFSRTNVAVMAGGTGLYIDALLNGIDEIPEVPAGLRESISAAYKLKGIEWLQTQLKEKDPVFFETSEKRNPHRLMRALEIIQHTGKSISHFRTAGRVHRNFKTIKIALDREREVLYNRINTRVDAMMDQGLLQEVMSLQPYQHLNALQTVGYRELFSFLHGSLPLEDAVEEIKKNTRRYAKRQLTWFKKDADYKWFAPENTAEILQYISGITNE